ncbi:MAG: ABC transporter permease [Chloroflexota bacterium]
MLSFAGTRVLQAIPSLLAVMVVAFSLMQLTGDVTGLMLPPEANETERAALKHAYGLDQPLPVQFARYLGAVLQGDFGRSFHSKRPAMAMVAERLPATVELTLSASFLAMLIGIPAGVISAVKRNSVWDRTATVGALVGQTAPTFWLGLILILVFAVHWQILPVSGRGSFAQLILPSVTLSGFIVALVTRLTRSGMLEVVSLDYVRTARAKGLSERSVLIRHALRNALIPIVTVMGLEIGGLLGGAVMTETVFNWPGVGSLMLTSIVQRDYPVVLAALVVVTALFVAVNLAVDLLCALLDPRVRASGGG